MAIANPTDNSRASIAQQDSQQSGPAVQVAPPSRREFLYYIWGASMALLLGEVTAGVIWFAFPRFREGEFGGVFPYSPDSLPQTGDAPEWVAAGRFHVSNTDNGLLALYGVCTHLGCLPKWVPTNTRFECPCHGSKFTGNGSYIEGPAPRALDRFPVTIIYADGTQSETDTSGGPVPLDSGKTIVDIRINTGSRILGPQNA